MNWERKENREKKEEKGGNEKKGEQGKNEEKREKEEEIEKEEMEKGEGEEEERRSAMHPFLPQCNVIELRLVEQWGKIGLNKEIPIHFTCFFSFFFCFIMCYDCSHFYYSHLFLIRYEGHD